MSQSDPFPQEPLDIVSARIGMLMADAGARDIARKLVQIERQLQSLFASHGTIFFNLRVERRLRRHEKILTRVKLERIIFCIDMMIFRRMRLSFGRRDRAAIYSFTITGVPSSAFSKNGLAHGSGKRMQPCDARNGGT